MSRVTLVEVALFDLKEAEVGTVVQERDGVFMKTDVGNVQCWVCICAFTGSGVAERGGGAEQGVCYSFDELVGPVEVHLELRVSR